MVYRQTRILLKLLKWPGLHCLLEQDCAIQTERATTVGQGGVTHPKRNASDRGIGANGG